MDAKTALPLLFLSHAHLILLFHLCSIRSPGSVAPRDVECEGFGITYARIASEKSRTGSSPSIIPDALENDVDKRVDDAIEMFLRKLSQIGPELMSVCRCCILSLSLL